MNLVWRQFSHVHPLGWPSSRPSILVFTICCPHLGFASKGQNTTKNNIWVCLKIGYSPKWLFQEGKRWLSSRFRLIFRPRYIPNRFPKWIRAKATGSLWATSHPPAKWPEGRRVERQPPANRSSRRSSCRHPLGADSWWIHKCTGWHSSIHPR